MRKIVHRVAGIGALALIAVFWTSTVIVELVGSHAAVAAVKTAILWALPVMVALMAAAGGSGMAMAPRARAGVLLAKRRRMPFIAANGLLVLVPSAIFLALRAGAGQFDTAFMIVQAVELVAGAVNITLLALNARDGFALRRRRPARA